MSEWKSIETAPNDKPILVYGLIHGVGEIGVRIRQDSRGYVWWMEANISGYDVDDDLDEKTITHWQPLPEPPQ